MSKEQAATQQHDIMDRTDRSSVPVFGRATGLSKAEKHSWASPGQPGIFEWIDKQMLRIDGRYQRSETSLAKVIAIAKEWDWKLVGAISVVQRDDGTLWVIDGGHRLRAAFMRKEVEEMPCMVFTVTELSEEAKAFVGANRLKSTVSAYHAHRAGVQAKEPVSMQIDALLKQYGYEASRDSKDPNGYCGLSALHRIMRIDEQSAKEAFEACSKIARTGETQIYSEVLRGIWTLHRRLKKTHNILSHKYLHGLMDKGMEYLLTSIRREKHITGNGGPRVEAKAILDVLNRGRRARILMPEWSDRDDNEEATSA